MISRENAEHYAWGGDCDGWHLVRRPELSVIHERMPPKRAEVQHLHERSRQFFFVISGELTLTVDGRAEKLGPGQGLEVAPGAPHKAVNDGDRPVEFLVISHPTTRGDRIDEA